MVDQQVAVQVMHVSWRMDVREDEFWMHEDARVVVERVGGCRALVGRRCWSSAGVAVWLTLLRMRSRAESGLRARVALGSVCAATRTPKGTRDLTGCYSPAVKSGWVTCGALESKRM